jgi:hypothetical protein
MKITINGKEHILKFGLKFLREIDKTLELTTPGGLKYADGFGQKLPMVIGEDPAELSEFLYMATAHEEDRPTQDEIDEYVEDCEDIDKLFKVVLSELKNSNITKKVTKRTAAVMDLAEKEEQTTEKTQKKPTTK